MYAEVIVDVLNSEVDKVFDYLVPKDFSVIIGGRVLVPFGNRIIEGYVLKLKEDSQYDKSKIKLIKTVIDEKPLILPDLMNLLFEMKSKYFLRYVDIIRLIVPSLIRDGKIKDTTQRVCFLKEDKVDEFTKTLRKNSKNPILVINYLNQCGKEKYSELTKKFTSNTIKKMIDFGVIFIEEQKLGKKQIEKLDIKDKKITLTDSQQKVITSIINSDKQETFLLHGVTGSGKTEVYLNVIKHVLDNNKTAIVLVPEISLTPQTVGIFVGRFGNNVAVLHSKLSQSERYQEWTRIYNGDAKIVIGARSAIFAPITNLGVVIIDEEHDSSYISESNPRFFTHDIAYLRTKYNDCPLILGSATPSIESYYKSQTGEYKLLEMPTRVNNKKMPEIQIVDMCNEFRSGNKTPFSKELLDRLQQTIHDKKQAILFINRRGFSSFLMCRDCGYIPKCESCDVTLSLHKQENLLKCHYCGKRYKALTRCPNCGSDNIKLGGVGTERVVSELKEAFPNITIFRMDNDTTRTKNAYSNILNNFSKTKPAILVGTQMVAKGHDFPEVNLVGILDADLSLFFNDFRSADKTFELITQVSGRAGRSEIEGHVILQTYFPKNYVYNLVANYDYKRFYAKEINLRQTTDFPPFSKIVRILYSSLNDDDAKESTHLCFQKLKELRIQNKEDFLFLEAMRSPVGKIQNKYRYQIITRFKLDKEFEILQKIYDISKEQTLKNVQCFVDINPISLS